MTKQLDTYQHNWEAQVGTPSQLVHPTAAWTCTCGSSRSQTTVTWQRVAQTPPGTWWQLFHWQQRHPCETELTWPSDNGWVESKRWTSEQCENKTQLKYQQSASRYKLVNSVTLNKLVFTRHHEYTIRLVKFEGVICSRILQSLSSTIKFYSSAHVHQRVSGHHKINNPRE